jgi:hypothetical protein
MTNKLGKKQPICTVQHKRTMQPEVIQWAKIRAVLFQGVLGVPPILDSLHAAIMPTLLSLLTAYIDEAMAYVGLSLGTNKAEPGEPSSGVSQYAGVSEVSVNQGVWRLLGLAVGLFLLKE